MARALVIKAEPFMADKRIEEIRKDVIRQYNDGGVIVVPKHFEVIEVDFDNVRVESEIIGYKKERDE